MVSIKNLFGAVLLATLASAQGLTTNFSSSDIQALAASTSNPSNDDKVAWCVSQRSTCSTLCGPRNNTCDPTTLQWTCLCPGNSSTAQLQYYPFSIVGNECNSLLGRCLSANANDLTAQQGCKTQYVCGNASNADATAAGEAAASATGSSSSAASSSSPASSSTAAPASSSTHSGAAIAAYGEFAPPMFVMMFVGALATFL